MVLLLDIAIYRPETVERYLILRCWFFGKFIYPLEDVWRGRGGEGSE